MVKFAKSSYSFIRHCLDEASGSRTILVGIFIHLLPMHPLLHNSACLPERLFKSQSYAGCPRKNASIKNLNSDLFVTPIHSFLISLDLEDV